MRTLGLIHCITAAGTVTSHSIEADSTMPALEVLRSAISPALMPADISIGNRVPAGQIDSISWARWHSLNPITVIGANILHTTTSVARVTDDSEQAPTTDRTEQATVSVVAGPDSGFTITVDPRHASVSRLPHAGSLTIVDPCISRTPQPLNLGAAHGEETSLIGATVLAPHRPSPQALLSRNRSSPIQFLSSQSFDDIHVEPKTIDDPRPARPPQWWTFLIPIGIGVVLAVATGMWWFLLFSVSAPISGYVAFIVEKKRFKRDCRQCEVDRGAALAEARTRLRQLTAEHRRRTFADPGLCLGFGTVFSAVTIDEQLYDAADHVDGRLVLAEMPIRIDPQVTTVSVSGDPDALRSVAFAWMSDHRFAWRPGPELALLPELAGTRLSAGLTQETAPIGGRTEPDPDSAIDLRLDATSEQAVLTLSAPRAASAISITLGTLAQARTLSSTAAGGPVPDRPLIATLMTPARFVTLHRDPATLQVPQPWPDHGLGELCDDAPEAIAAAWRQPRPGPVLIGRGTDGDIGIDLFADGPHALVAGTTGSGKSLLLQTWLLSMALAQPPRRLRFVLIDFKGGATFAPLQTLPHTDSVLDDFDSGLAFRALASVRAEITRRERLLADQGCADVLDLADPPPRLVVVIDEFHALMATHPRAADLLEHLTALGRSLGVHLILATQRPLGVVTGQMKANINIRVCLRVRDETDSFDVVGTEAGALLPADKPGAACIDDGMSVSQFRVAVPFGTDSRTEAALRPRVRPWTRGPVPSLASGVRGISVANIITAAASDSASVPQRQVVLPPLPGPEELAGGTGGWLGGANDDSVRVGDGPSGAGRALVTGIIDVPSQQRQQAWRFAPDADGSLILTGGSPEIVESVLVNMARAAASTRRIIAVGRIAAALDWAEIRCGMNSGWQIQAVLDHLIAGSRRGPTAQDRSGSDTQSEARTQRVQGTDFQPPSLLVCSNWAEFVDSLDHYWAERAERLLGHGASSGLTFLLAGCRNMTSRNSRFATQIIFPPEAGEDGTSVGLSRQRFAGTWPDFRAVIRGPCVQTVGGEGADVQLMPAGPVRSEVLSEQAERKGFTPRWLGLDQPANMADSVRSVAGVPGLAPIGVDAFGDFVGWNPLRDGSVLTVRGSPQSGKSGFAALLDRLGGVTVHDDAHLDEDPADLDLLDGRFHVLTVPTRFAPGYGSPLAKAQNLGPLLVLGVHTRQDLTGLGLLRQSPLDGLPGTGWFVTEEQARPIRLFTAEEARVFFSSDLRGRQFRQRRQEVP